MPKKIVKDALGREITLETEKFSRGTSSLCRRCRLTGRAVRIRRSKPTGTGRYYLLLPSIRMGFPSLFTAGGFSTNQTKTPEFGIPFVADELSSKADENACRCVRVIAVTPWPGVGSGLTIPHAIAIEGFSLNQIAGTFSGAGL